MIVSANTAEGLNYLAKFDRASLTDHLREFFIDREQFENDVINPYIGPYVLRSVLKAKFLAKGFSARGRKENIKDNHLPTPHGVNSALRIAYRIN